jgi:hypothetical protein
MQNKDEMEKIIQERKRDGRNKTLKQALQDKKKSLMTCFSGWLFVYPEKYFLNKKEGKSGSLTSLCLMTHDIRVSFRKNERLILNDGVCQKKKREKVRIRSAKEECSI